MSRNVRQKRSAAAVKVAKRRGSDSSSSLDLSDDDGYSAVEDVSDSEDDEEDVEAAEEQHILSHTKRRSPRPGNGSDEDEEDEDDDGKGGDNDDDIDLNDADEEEEGEDEDADDSRSWDGILSETEESTVPEVIPNNDTPRARSVTSSERHVRFAGVPDSDSDSDSTTTETTEDISEFFPDLFVAQSSLDPAFRREIEHGDDQPSSGSDSFWDHGMRYDLDAANGGDSDVDFDAIQDMIDCEPPIATSATRQAATEVSTPTPSPSSYDLQELDGYETDGDTTDEDVPEPPVRRKVRRVESVDESSDSDVEQIIRVKPGQPRVGRFNLDRPDRKPIVVANPLTRKMMIFTPQRLSGLDLSPETFNFQFFDSIDNPSAPMLANSGSIMMGAMFSQNTFGDFVNSHPVGAPEAFFPMNSDAMEAVDDSSESELDADEDEEEKMLTISDFLHFEDGSSDEEEEGAWNDGSDAATPRPQTANVDTEMHPLLTHFSNNSDAVGAFRLNQTKHQLIHTNQATLDSLAFSSPFSQGTIRGVKDGSLDTVTTPITPLRRRKSTAHDMTSSPRESGTQKRKASSDHKLDHKRHRSISDVKTLNI